jgi:hypothetical protein
MPRYIVKIPHEGQDYYLDWSTIVDAPVTYGLSLDEFKEYYRGEYGRSSLMELDERLARVNEKGTSSVFHKNLEDLICCNRAGANEAKITLPEIIQRYIVDKNG